MKAKFLSILLALTMVLSLLPTAVLAEDSEAECTDASCAHVAAIGDVHYDSLQVAIDAAESGATVKLLKDIDLSLTVSVEKQITLDMNGKKLYNTEELWCKPDNEENNNWSLISVREGGDLTVTGEGTLDAKENDCYAIDLQGQTSKCTIENGTFVGNIHAVYVERGKLIVNGGSYSIRQKYPDADKADEFVLNCYDDSRREGTATITVSGGHFEGFNPADCKAEGAGTNFCAEGYTTSKDESTNTYTVVSGENSAVANAGANYNSLANAIATVTKGTVTLLADTVEAVVIPSGKDITLDLNGHKIVNSATPQDKDVAEALRKHTITNNGTLTILDSASGGVVDNVSHSCAAIYNAGTITEIKSGKFTRSVDASIDASSANGNSWYVVYNAKDATISKISGGEFLAVGKFSSLFCNSGSIGEISGGTFTQDGFIAFKNEGTIDKISGGTFSSADESCIQNWGSIGEITGGAITAGSIGIWNFSSDQYASPGTIGKISGGNISGTTAAIRLSDYDTIYLTHSSPSITNKASASITGGNISGALQVNDNTTLTVSGGHFSEPVKTEYLDSSLNAELNTGKGDTPYSYYTTVEEATAAAKEAGGGIITSPKAAGTTEYTVTLKYHNGETADQTLTVADGGIVILPTPTHSGRYTFRYWTDGTGTYNAGDAYTVTGSATLNAVWHHIGPSSPSSSGSSITVGKTENGTITVSPKTASKGETVTITVKPADGYELDRLTATNADGDTIRLTEQRDGTYIFTMPAGKVEVSGTFVKQSAQTFVDVPENAYYAPAVAWAVEKGVTEGTSATTFSPDAACTRAQIVTFLYRAAGSPAVKSTVNPFTDVSASDYCYNAVLWAVENGITTGTNETTFSPNESCTRAQCAAFLYRYEQSQGKGFTGEWMFQLPFTDVPDWCYESVAWCYMNGVTEGTSATTFSPDTPCTRAQIVTFLYRADQVK